MPLRPCALNRSAFFALLLLMVIGCGDGHGLVPVAGQVTLDGQPVTQGRIDFFPTSGRPSSGQLDAEGRYTLKTFEPGDGAKPGSYVVTVTSRQVSGGASEPEYNSMEAELAGDVANPEDLKRKRAEPLKVKWLVPQKYSNRTSSGLTREVGSQGEDIDFQLQSKP